MIATGGALSFAHRIAGMGLHSLDAEVDLDALRRRGEHIQTHLHDSVCQLLGSQGVRLVRGVGGLKGPHAVVVEPENGTDELTPDAIVLSTGSRPRIPDWAEPDGARVLT